MSSPRDSVVNKSQTLLSENKKSEAERLSWAEWSPTTCNCTKGSTVEEAGVVL